MRLSKVVFLLLAFFAVLGLAKAVFAEGVVCKTSTCRLTFTEPQTNTDGSNLNDLAAYEIYIATTSAGVVALATPSAVLPATVPDPAPGATVTYTGVRSLVPGQYYVQIIARDVGGNRSPRTPVVPFVLQDDVPPSAAGTPIISD